MSRPTAEIINELEELVHYARRADRLEETIAQLGEQINLLTMVIDTMHNRIRALRNERDKAKTPPIRPVFWDTVDEVVALLDDE